jgi:type IV pilus assembly protein PilE
MKNGFSLVELLLVLGLIGLLAAMAYPNYTHVLVRTRRLEAQTALLNLANRLEQDNAQALSQTKSLTRWYDFSIQKKQNKRYVLTATPLDSQGSHDVQCQSLTLTSEGVEGIAEGPKGAPRSLTEECWN